MEFREWNAILKELRGIILKEDKIEESRSLALELHAMVHESSMTDIAKETFEDKLWNGMIDNSFRVSQNDKGRTVAYGMYHCSRIEDITMNILVADREQVFTEGKWQEKIKSNITDTGNWLDADGILEFSSNIDMNQLRNYRNDVGRRTREIISSLSGADMKNKFTKEQLQRILDEGAVKDVESANWLIDFWGKKNTAGIILMPGTRHNMIHISESMKAKKHK